MQLLFHEFFLEMTLIDVNHNQNSAGTKKIQLDLETYIAIWQIKYSIIATKMFQKMFEQLDFFVKWQSRLHCMEKWHFMVTLFWTSCTNHKFFCQENLLPYRYPRRRIQLASLKTTLIIMLYPKLCSEEQQDRWPQPYLSR